jgi:hypothetical protein
MVHIPLDGPHRPSHRPRSERSELLVSIALAVALLVVSFLLASIAD